MEEVGTLRIDEVDTDVFVLDEDLAVGRGGDGEVSFVFEDLDTTGLLDHDALHGLGDCSGHGARTWGLGEVRMKL
jgi:hypothetical protein